LKNKRDCPDFPLGVKSATEYAKVAQDLFKNTETTERFVGNDGTVRVYEASTNTFGAYKKTGEAKTVFKPTSKNYWNNQKKQYGK
jgi:pyocin large subunit-like protein